MGMRRKILLWLIERLYKMAYEPTTFETLDPINKKLIRPVPGLVINGVQYYEFVQIADMPEQRRAVYMDVRREMSMGIDNKLLLEYIAKIKDANNKKEGADVSRIGSLLFMLEDTIMNI